MEIPNEVKFVIQELRKQGFEAYIVGGCVRDFLRGAEPEDWDCATNAKPEQIIKIFPKSFYENKFGTVTAQIKEQRTPHHFFAKSSEGRTANSEQKNKEKIIEIEITPYRTESKYTDKRHPDEIKWAKTIEEDLGRRDFTVNAMAIDIDIKFQNTNYKLQTKPKTQITKHKQEFKIIDLFGGQKDLEKKIIRAVGEPDTRFSEDALRLMRAVRFANTLGEGWKIEPKTKAAIKKNAGLLQMISKERIRDEFMKIIMSKKAADGVELLRELGLLKYIVPELEEGYNVKQNKHHIYDVYEHLLLSLKYAAEKNFNKYVRLAALFHDIGKPRTKRGEGDDATFYNHELVSARMCLRILNRLRFSKKDIEKTVRLVRYHLFYYNVDEVGEASVRRLVRQAGPENIEELLQLRFCDRIGSGVPKAEPYKLRHLRYIIEKVSQDPISVKMLKANGEDIMRLLDIKPGPKIGAILDILLGYVLEDPKKNKKDFLEQEIKRLGKLLDSEIFTLSKKSIQERQKVVTKRDEMTKKKYWVT